MKTRPFLLFLFFYHFLLIYSFSFTTTKVNYFKYGGRTSTYEVLQKEFPDTITADISLSELHKRQEEIGKKYLSTFCSVTYYHLLKQSILKTREELCVIHLNSSTFYTLWDGFNVQQTIKRNIADSSISGRVPQPYENNNFYIVSRSAALIYDGEQITAISFDRTKSLLINEMSQFKVKNHPSGKGVMIESVSNRGNCLFYKPELDKKPILMPCQEINPYQKFLWSGNYLQSPWSNEFLHLKYKVIKSSESYKEGIVTRYRERITYEIEADFYNDYKYYDTYSSLTLMSVNGNEYRYFGRVLQSDPFVEQFYNDFKVLENDTFLQEQLNDAYLPLKWSSANQLFSLPFHCLLTTASLIVVLCF